MARRLSQEEVISRLAPLAKDKNWDLSRVDYRGMSKKVEVLCLNHSPPKSFFSRPDNLLNNKGCPACGELQRRSSKRVKYEEFLRRATKAHGARYVYGVNSAWGGVKSTVDIYCPEHGKFQQLAENHCKGHGCNSCADKERASSTRENYAKEFFLRFSVAHGGEKYDYSRSCYSAAKSKMEIICKEHGRFFQTPDSHARGNGCPKCVGKVSKTEQFLADFLSSLGFEVHQNRRDVIPPQEVDIFLPEQKLAIEFNGSFWHSTKKKDREYHLNKTLAAEAAGIRLIHVFDYVHARNPELVMRMLAKAAGVGSQAIGARKCEVLEIPSKVSRDFCKQHHLMGGASASVHVGLHFEGRLVAVASFTKRSTGGSGLCHELIRYCVPPEIVIPGGLQRILKFVQGKYEWPEITSYVDRTWFDGDSYEKSGWQKISESAPAYWYVDRYSLKAYHRRQFMKSNLPHQVGKYIPFFDPDLSESEHMWMSRLFRVFDCGHKKYLYTANSG